jgi:hypothetical protein
MKINRENYEIWFIDWLDNNLSPEDVEELEFFLEQNQDLREEFSKLTDIKLEPSSLIYSGKDRLKKTAGELSSSQFEYLCAAYVGNDLSKQQEADLEEMTKDDQEKSKTLDLFRQTRVIPPKVVFKNKKQLLKRTIEQKIIRFSKFALSAAAIAALVLISHPFRPEPLIDTISNTALNSTQSNNVTPPAFSGRENEEESIHVKKEAPSVENEKMTAESSPLTDRGIVRDSISKSPDREQIAIRQIELKDIAIIEYETLPAFLAASPQFTPPPAEDDQSKIGKFLAKNFREKIMKQDLPDDSPLKSYEVAEAGITGLNKLFGWDMALTLNSDENGEPSSVHFNSRMLKFNTPVKKSSSSR